MKNMFYELEPSFGSMVSNLCIDFGIKDPFGDILFTIIDNLIYE